MEFNFNIKIVALNLWELHSKERQLELWLNDGSKGPFISMPCEAMCGLFDDSGLSLVFPGRTGLSPEFEERLGKLDQALQELDDRIDLAVLIESAPMEKIRQLAGLVLDQLHLEAWPEPYSDPVYQTLVGYGWLSPKTGLTRSPVGGEATTSSRLSQVPRTTQTSPYSRRVLLPTKRGSGSTRSVWMSEPDC